MSDTIKGLLVLITIVLLFAFGTFNSNQSKADVLNDYVTNVLHPSKDNDGTYVLCYLNESPITFYTTNRVVYDNTSIILVFDSGEEIRLIRTQCILTNNEQSLKAIKNSISYRNDAHTLIRGPMVDIE